MEWVSAITSSFFLGQREMLPSAYSSILHFLSRLDLPREAAEKLAQSLHAARALDDRMVSAGGTEQTATQDTSLATKMALDTYVMHLRAWETGALNAEYLEMFNNFSDNLVGAPGF